MSLVLNKEPFEISFSRNPVYYEVFTNNLYDSIFVFPYLELTFSDKCTVGDAFTFDITDPDSEQIITIYFQAVTTPIPGDNTFQSDSFPGTLPQYVDQVADQLNDNSLFSTYFKAVSDGVDKIRMTAVEAIEELVPVNYSDVFQSPGLPSQIHFTEFIYTIAITPVRRSDYSIELEVFFERNFEAEDWEMVAQLNYNPKNDGTAPFDIANILDAEFKRQLIDAPLPDYLNDNFYVADLKRRFYVRYRELYTGGPTDANWVIGDTKIVQCGGFSLEDYTKQNPFQYLTANEAFLTWTPDGKKMQRTQKDWLTWLNYFKEEKFDFQLRIFWTDNTDSDWENVHLMDLDKWDTVTIPVGPETLEVEEYEPSKTVFKYEVRIRVTGSTIVSEVRTFYLEQLCFPCMTALVYLNSFCAPESVILLGETEKMLKTKKKSGTRALKHDYKMVNGQTFQWEQNSREMFKGRTGYRPAEYIESLQDVFISAQPFIIENDRYVPIYIEQSSFFVSDCTTFWPTLEFDFEKSFLLENYSEAEYVPTLYMDIDCGFNGVKINQNGETVTTYGDLTIKDSNGLTVSTTVFDNLYGGWPFATPIETEDLYEATVQLILDGSTSKNLIVDLNFKNVHINWETSISATHGFYGRLNTGTEDLFTDWGVGTGEVALTHTTGFSFFSIGYTLNGVKQVDANTNCPEKWNDFYLFNQDVENVNFERLEKLNNFGLPSCGIKGTFRLTPFIDAVFVWLSFNAIDKIEIGFHRDLEQLRVDNNNLSAEEIERLLLRIWKYRKAYSVPTPFMNVLGNPGAGVNMTATAISIIDGTGIYSGEGLVSDYNWTIFY